MRRVTQISFRTNDHERQALQSMASQEGRCTSEMLRELLREGAQRRGVWPEPQGKATQQQGVRA